jgi:plastocyanin
MKTVCLLIIIFAVVASCVLTPSAFANDAKVLIVNGTSNHCRPDLSCYKPFEVNIIAGDTVTWENHDNRVHTVTAGTTNQGPVGLFDSGEILPDHSFTQFFGTVGRYQYFDKTDWWPSGIVIVSKSPPANPRLEWIQGSVTLMQSDSNINSLVISKHIQNTGSSDVNSIVFRLKIRNETGFLLYDNMTTANVPARHDVPISFVWTNPQVGKYQLIFDANAANLMGYTNATKDVPLDTIFISKNNGIYLVPEFPFAIPILLVSVMSLIVFFRLQFRK